MPEFPKVSICCITYNHEPYIRDCLEGFLMQKTDFAYEILIHDDASTDKTADIIREYEKKYPDIIRAVYQTENQYSKTHNFIPNFQFDKARGKYIAICEGDDFWVSPDKLQIQFDFMEANPDYSMCFHQAYVYFHGVDSECCKNIFSCIENKDYSAEEIVCEWKVSTGTVFLRKEYFIPFIPYDCKDFLYGDIMFFLTAASHGKVRGMSGNMSVYRRLQTGIVLSQRYDNRLILAHLKHYLAIERIFHIRQEVIDELIFRIVILSFKNKCFNILLFIMECGILRWARVNILFVKYVIRKILQLIK